MNEIQYNNNPALRLKKVKRPINRMEPQRPVTPAIEDVVVPEAFENEVQQETVTIQETPPQAPYNPFAQARTTPAAPAPEVKITEEDFDIDAYLDVDDNLPSLRNTPSKFKAKQPEFIEDDDEEETEYVTGSDLPEFLNKKVLIILACVIFFMGFVFSKLLFTEEKVVRNGLQGVVTNIEVPLGRARCGVAEKTQGCVLYIMNPQRQELSARDFYDLASQLTGRQKFVIETGNMRYSNTKIRPGDVAQINIPPL